MPKLTSVFAQVEHLIKPLLSENTRLYQALSIIAKGVDKVNTVSTINQEVTYGIELRINLPGVRANGTDTCDVWPRIYLPRNAGNNLVSEDLPNWQPRLNLQYIGISAKVPLAGGGPYLPDILISRDQGVTFNSIFKLTNPLQLIVGQVTGSNSIFQIGTLLDGDLIRIDETGTDGVLEGIELYILGNLSTAVNN
jgi:hypothetical protein